MFAFEVQLTPEEFKDYYEYVFVTSPQRRKALLRRVIMMGIFQFLLISFLLYSINDYTVKTDAFIWATVISIGLSYFSYSRFSISVRSQAEKTMQETGGEIYTSHNEYTFSEKGIHVKQPVGEFLYYWQAFNRIETVKNCTYLFISSRQAMIIPHRVLDNAEKKKMFESLLSTYMPVNSVFNSLLKK